MAANYLPNIGDDALRGRLSAFYDEAERVLSEANPGIADELKYYSRLPMHLVPYQQRIQLFKQYRNAIGLDDTLSRLSGQGPELAADALPNVPSLARQRVGNIYSSLNTTVAMDTSNAFGRLPGNPAGDGSLLGNIYSGLNIQFRDRVQLDRAGLTTLDAARPSSYFTVGLSSIPSRSSLDQLQYTPGMLQGKSSLVYDIETAGLSKGQIREVSYAVDGRADQILFNPPEFNRGLVNVDGRAGTLSDFLRRQGLGVPTAATTGDDFAAGVEPFLRSVINTDYIVGHNITGFDTEQMFVGLSRTSRYQSDQAFRELADQAFEKMRTSSIDTLNVVKGMGRLQPLRTASELSAMGNQNVFSIQNLLLKTDLIERMGGVREFEALMGAHGLHHANVDVAVTKGILDAAEAGGLRPKNMETGLSGEELTIARRIKQQIISSSAITPMTNVGGVDQITDSVLKTLIDSYETGDSGLRVKPGSELDKLLKTNKAAAYRALRSGEMAPMGISLTPIEQQIIQERNLAQTGVSEDPMSVVRAGKRNISAFSGLSTDEARIARGLSGATASLSALSEVEGRVAAVAEGSMVSRFQLFDPRSVQYSTRSGRPSMGISLLENAGIDVKSGMARLSIVEPTASNKGGAVNVVRDLSVKEQDKLKSFVTSLATAGDEDVAQALGVGVDDATSIANFRNAVDNGLVDNLGESGVSIAQLYGGSDPSAVRKITDLFKRQFNVEGMVDDKALRNFRLPIMNIDSDRGILRTAGVVLNKGLGREGQARVATAVESTARLNDNFMAMGTGRGFRMRMAENMTELSGRVSSEAVEKIYDNVANKIIPNLGKGVIGIAAVGAGALLFSRAKENQALEDTLAFQGYESSGQGQYAIYDQIQARVASGYDGYANQVDPLATASVTSNLNNRRANHANYDWERNQQLYGGLL